MNVILSLAIGCVWLTTGFGQRIRAPGNFRVLLVQNPTTATFTWTAPSGSYEGFKLIYWHYPNDEESKRPVRKTLTLPQSSRETTIDDLIPAQYNFAELHVYTGQWNGPATAAIRFRMPEGLPGPIKDLKTQEFSDRAVKLTWNPPESAYGRVVGYRLKIEAYKQVGSQRKAATLPRYKILSHPSQTSYLTNRLLPNMNYVFIVQARTRTGYGLPTSISFRTKPTTDFN